MRQFLLPSLGSHNTIIIEGQDYHYLTHVLRKKRNDTFNGIDEMGAPYQLTIKEIKGRSLTAVAVKAVKQEKITSDSIPISLYQCMPKMQKMDRIIRQATEIGVGSITPVISVHSLSNTRYRYDRWNRIIKGAVQQSGSRICPVIHTPVNLNALAEQLKIKNSVKILFFHQNPVNNSSLHELLFDCSEGIGVLIGPEGGFSEEEVRLMLKAGFCPVHMGENILRTETAAVSAITAVKIILLEKTDWKLK